MIKLNITSHPVGTKILLQNNSVNYIPGGILTTSSIVELEIEGWTTDSRLIKLEGKWRVASLVDCVGVVAMEPKWKIRKDLETTPYIPYIPYSPPYCPHLPYTYPYWNWASTDIKLNIKDTLCDPILGKGTTY